MVATILQNEVYIGNLAQCKNRMIRHKVHKKLSVPKDNEVVVKNTHEAIIDVKTFNKVQDLLFSRDVIDNLIDYIYVQNDGNIIVSFKYKEKNQNALDFIKNNKLE